MQKKAFVLSSIATSLLISATALSGYLLSNKLMYIKQKDEQLILNREQTAKRYDQKWFDAIPKTRLHIHSSNGYQLAGYFMKPLPTNNTIIICHGVTENKINSVKYARMFEKMGYNTVIYDHRRHGETGGKTTSYGFYEKKDLQHIIRFIRRQIGPDAILGIHGESMGAATMLMYAAEDANDVNFYIADSSFSDLSTLLRILVKNTLSVDVKFFVRLTNLALRIRDGYTTRHVSPLTAVQHIKQPVLFIHNINDTFIPAEMAFDLYSQKQGSKMLRLFEKGDHTQAFNETPKLYEHTVAEFLLKFIHRKHIQAV